MDLKSTGIWFHTDALTTSESTKLVQQIEALGFGTFWFGEGFGRDPLVHAASLLAETNDIVIATGVASIYSRDPVAMMGGANALGEQSDGRFLLGIGVSMPPLVEPRGHQFGPPIATMRNYLAAMKACQYASVPPKEPVPIVLAALGPKMLEFAGQQTRGAHPCNVTPEYTKNARARIGSEPWLCIEQKVVLESSPSLARAIARRGLALYLAVPHQRANWTRMGFDESDYLDGGSNRLIDALIAWGNIETIQARVRAHLDAGASHVCLQPILPEGERVPSERLLESLA